MYSGHFYICLSVCHCNHNNLLIQPTISHKRLRVQLKLNLSRVLRVSAWYKHTIFRDHSQNLRGGATSLLKCSTVWLQVHFLQQTDTRISLYNTNHFVLLTEVHCSLWGTNWVLVYSVGYSSSSKGNFKTVLYIKKDAQWQMKAVICGLTHM